MTLVVFAHVLGFSFYSEGANDFINLFPTFRMPLFFFVSGFVLYKASAVWNLKNTRQFLFKKFKVQILATLFFLALYSYMLDANLIHVLFDSMKYGYWFTYVLFIFFCIYSLTHLLLDRLGKNISDIVLFIIGCILLVFWLVSNKYGWIPKDISGLLSLERWKYFIYFFTGTMTRKHFHLFEQLLDNSKAMAMLLLIYLTLSLLYFRYQIFPADLFLDYILGFFGIVVVFAFFRKNKSTFDHTTKCGAVMQYIGRRTLDIYFLHYFFLPRNCKFIGEFFTTYSNPVLELVVGLAFAAIVIAICLIVSNIVRLSPHLAHYLFGVKLDTNK